MTSYHFCRNSELTVGLCLYLSDTAVLTFSEVVHWNQTWHFVEKSMHYRLIVYYKLCLGLRY